MQHYCGLSAKTARHYDLLGQVFQKAHAMRCGAVSDSNTTLAVANSSSVASKRKQKESNASSGFT